MQVLSRYCSKAFRITPLALISAEKEDVSKVERYVFQIPFQVVHSAAYTHRRPVKAEDYFHEARM